LSDFLSSRPQAWNLHQTCKQYGQRPSTLMAIDDPWMALTFDQTLAAFGLEIEAKLQERNAKGKPKYTLKELLSEETGITRILSLALALGDGVDL